MLCGREHTPCDTGAFWKLDMHVHSACSADSINTIQAIVHSWRKTRVLPLVCDHNSIRGSAQVYAAIRKEDPDIPQILSEEILTRDGDLIGVFLTEEITPGRPADETLDAIHSRGGLAIVPHPFCSYRDSRITPHVLEEITPRIDCIEAFNARNIRPEDNQLALSHARCHSVPVSVGSDAHLPIELASSYLVLRPFATPGELMKNICTASITFRRTNPNVRYISRMVRTFNEWNSGHVGNPAAEI